MPERVHVRFEQFIRARARSVDGTGEPSGADSNTTIACVLVTHLKDRPAVIIGRCRGRPVVVDYFPAAAEVVTGMTPEQALSRHPDSIVLEADEAA